MWLSDIVKDADRILHNFTVFTFEVPNDLCSGGTVDSHGFDRQTRSVEGELLRWEGCHHCRKRGSGSTPDIVMDRVGLAGVSRCDQCGCGDRAT